MYLQHFGLNQEPFHITPDPRFFYLSPSHKEAFAAFIYGIKNRKGFIAVIGEVGLGKTTVLRTYLDQQNSKGKIKTIFVFNPNITFKGLVKIIYAELGLSLPQSTASENSEDSSRAAQSTASDEIFDLVHNLHLEMIREFSEGTTVVLIIDEAQNMPVDTLENLRLLSNLESSTSKLLQIVLIGQPELEKTLNRQELRQLKQRIAIRAILRPLNKKQTRDYIRHRIKRAGRPGRLPFTRSALALIYKKTHGTPRSINILCDNALITAYGYGKDKVGTAIIREVYQDISGQSFHGRKKLAYSMTAAFGLVVAAVLLAGWQYGPEPLIKWTSKLQSAAFSLSKPQDSGQPTTPEPIQETRPSHQAEFSGPDTRVLQMPVPPLLPQEPESAIQASVPPQPPQPGPEVAYPVSTQAVLDQDVKDIPPNGSAPAEQEPLTQEITRLLTDTPRKRIHDQLDAFFSFYDLLSPTRQLVLVEMYQQMSMNGFLTFERMIDALYEQDFDEASRQMIFSQWHDRIGRPADELARIMKSNDPRELTQWIARHGS